MKHGSLFSGIGGFDLAAEWMGWENVFHCEWNPFGQKILNYYWPKAISYADITTTDFTIHRGAIDILTGGFPCQPYSQAGKRLGKEDDRHLWPEMLRAIGEIQPSWVVGENVRGLTNWNGGMVFDEVQADLEAKGYEILPFLLPACAVNAPHRRDRIWFIAYSQCNHDIRAERRSNAETEGMERIHWQENGTSGKFGGADKYDAKGYGQVEYDKTSSDADINQRLKGRMYTPEREKAERHSSSRDARSYERGDWQNFPTQPPICNGDDGISTRLDGIAFSKWRNESIMSAGNAIVPQVAYQIFKAIEQYEKNNL